MPFHQTNLPKGRHFTYLEDPGMHLIWDMVSLGGGLTYLLMFTLKV